MHKKMRYPPISQETSVTSVTINYFNKLSHKLSVTKRLKVTLVTWVKLLILLVVSLVTLNSPGGRGI